MEINEQSAQHEPSARDAQHAQECISLLRVGTVLQLIEEAMTVRDDVLARMTPDNESAVRIAAQRVGEACQALVRAAQEGAA